MSKIKRIFKDIRVIILLFFLLLSFLAIGHQSDEGVVIKGVAQGSDAYEAGIRSPDSSLQPTELEEIISINGKEINSMKDFNEAINSIGLNESVEIKTDKDEYIFLKNNENIGLSVRQKPSSNLRKGLDLEGGTRVLLKPEGNTTDQEIKDIISVMEERLNVYGLSDINVRSASDLFGEKYIVVEIAGASREEVKELIGKQGVFEAKIGNETVFRGGKKDVTFVCRNDGTCAGIRGCSQSQGGYVCQFQFGIGISEEAAKKHAGVTKDLEIITENGKQYLNKKIDFYLDGKKVDSLNIGADLKGQVITSIAISGPGEGKTRNEAIEAATENMNHLQTILITGSLPKEIEIIKLDSISPSLGQAFVRNALLTGLFALLAVGVVIFIRYRKIKISLPMVICMLSEIYIVLGLATLMRYNLDLAAIAGIIASVGTGVDDQIVIADEIMEKDVSSSFKERIKKAFFIIFAAYATTVAAMIPLLRAGAGLLTGFAFVTIAGVTIGVLITRPAFASIARILLEE